MPRAPVEALRLVGARHAPNREVRQPGDLERVAPRLRRDEDARSAAGRRVVARRREHDGRAAAPTALSRRRRKTDRSRAGTRGRDGAASGMPGSGRCSEDPEAACPAPSRATLRPPRSRHDVLPVLRRTRRPRCAGLPAMRPRPRGAHRRAEDHAPARAPPDRAHALARRAPDRRRPRGRRGRVPARREREGARGSRGQARPARAGATAPLARAPTGLFPRPITPPNTEHPRRRALTPERDRGTARP
jgi:hypothetical protein